MSRGVVKPIKTDKVPAGKAEALWPARRNRILLHESPRTFAGRFIDPASTAEAATNGPGDLFAEFFRFLQTCSSGNNSRMNSMRQQHHELSGSELNLNIRRTPS